MFVPKIKLILVLLLVILQVTDAEEEHPCLDLGVSVASAGTLEDILVIKYKQGSTTGHIVYENGTEKSNKKLTSLPRTTNLAICHSVTIDGYDFPYASNQLDLSDIDSFSRYNADYNGEYTLVIVDNWAPNFTWSYPVYICNVDLDTEDSDYLFVGGTNVGHDQDSKSWNIETSEYSQSTTQEVRYKVYGDDAKCGTLSLSVASVSGLSAAFEPSLTYVGDGLVDDPIIITANALHEVMASSDYQSSPGTVDFELVYVPYYTTSVTVKETFAYNVDIYKCWDLAIDIHEADYETDQFPLIYAQQENNGADDLEFQWFEFEMTTEGSESTFANSRCTIGEYRVGCTDPNG